MSERMRLDGRTAVITGAAGGIGRAIAVSLAQRDCHLALADVDESGMAGTEDLVRGYDVRVSRHRIDVADRVAVAGFPNVVAAEHSGVNVLVNNAGVAVGGTFEQVSDEDFEWLFEINFWGGPARAHSLQSTCCCVCLPRSPAKRLCAASSVEKHAYSSARTRRPSP